MAAAEPPGAGALPQLVSSGAGSCGGLGAKAGRGCSEESPAGLGAPLSGACLVLGRPQRAPPARSGEAALEE